MQGTGRRALGWWLSSLWAGYESKVASHPVLTKSLTSSVLYFLGDAVAQGVEGLSSPAAGSASGNSASGGAGEDEHARKSYSLARGARMAVFGFCFTGPMLHYWYSYLDRRLPSTAPKTVALKTAIDQVVMAPVWTVAFFGAMSAMEGRSLEDTKLKFEHHFLPTLLVDFLVWPAANVVNFRYVPPRHRVLYINLVNLLWCSFLGHMQHRAIPQKQPQQTETR
ncbi:Protein required for ethanol metabolism [Balamuthia mandrillaris]